MMRKLGITVALIALPVAALADNLYRGSNWPAMSTDRKASRVGDVLTVVVYENAESSNTTKSDSKRNTQLGGSLSAGGVNESGNLNFGGGYAGGGGVQRSDRVIAQISVTVRRVLANGDMEVSGCVVHFHEEGAQVPRRAPSDHDRRATIVQGSDNSTVWRGNSCGADSTPGDKGLIKTIV